MSFFLGAPVPTGAACVTARLVLAFSSIYYCSIVVWFLVCIRSVASLCVALPQLLTIFMWVSPGTIFMWVSPCITMFRESTPLLSDVTLLGIFGSAGSPVVQVCLPVVVLIGYPVSALAMHHCVVTILGI